MAEYEAASLPNRLGVLIYEAGITPDEWKDT